MFFSKTCLFFQKRNIWFGYRSLSTKFLNFVHDGTSKKRKLLKLGEEEKLQNLSSI